jgi:hypothetical protein
MIATNWSFARLSASASRRAASAATRSRCSRAASTNAARRTSTSSTLDRVSIGAGSPRASARAPVASARIGRLIRPVITAAEPSAAARASALATATAQNHGACTASPGIATATVKSPLATRLNAT